MKTNITKWDEGMGVRCLARFQDNFVPAASVMRGVNTYKALKKIATPEKTSPEKTSPEKTSPEIDISVNIAKGEWDDFGYALSSTLKKKHK